MKIIRNTAIKTLLMSAALVISHGATASADTLRFVTHEPEGILGYQAKIFGDGLEKATNGDLKLQYYWSGSLLPAAQMASGIADGIADMGMILPPYNPSEFPIANWATVLGSSAETVFPLSMLQAAAANAEAVLNSPDLAKEFADQGLVILTPLFAYPGFDLLCKEPVTNLAEAKGKRVRVGGNLWATEAQRVGMEPVALPGSDVYQAAQRGIVDCVMQHPPGFVGNGVWEVITHFTPTQFTGWNAMFLVMSQSRWNSLDELQKDAVMASAADYFVATHEKSLRDHAIFAGEGAEKQGIVYHAMSDDLAEAISKAQEQGRAEAISNAPGTLSDPEAFVEAYLAAMAKWKDIVFAEGFSDVDLGDANTVRAGLVAAGELEVSKWGDLVRKEVFSTYRPN